jgi:alcohol dehydrogenase
LRAALLRRYGGRVEYAEVPEPSPQPGELLVRVYAASINPVDWKTQQGQLKLIIPYPLPLVLGNDCSGVVEQVGAGVTAFKPGDEVYARVAKERIGTYAEYALVSEADAATKPANLSHVEAASLPLVGLTSWQALREIGHVGPGKRVLIHAGAGGIGTFAIQLAHALGAEVCTTASSKDHDRLRSLGADVLIDYHRSDFSAQLRNLDMVFDTQGGRTLLKSFRVTRRGGVVVSIGGIPHRSSLEGFKLKPGLGLLLNLLNFPMFALAGLKSIHYEYLFMKPSGLQLKLIAELVEEGRIKPVIDKTFPLRETQAALDYVKSGHSKGKVVVEIHS